MQSTLNKEKCLYAGAFLSVFFGGLVYVFWRPDSLRLFGWIGALGLRNPVELLRSFFDPLYCYLPEWFVFSLPNGLWAFAYALLISHLWRDVKSPLRYFWLGSIPVVGMGYEMSQYLGIISGTFCLGDLAFSACGIGFGVLASSLLHDGGNE